MTDKPLDAGALLAAFDNRIADPQSWSDLDANMKADDALCKAAPDLARENIALKAEVAAMRAAANKDAGDGWLPIETAPKDWKPTLVWDSRELEIYFVEKRADDGSCWTGDWDWQLPHPTHFMPRPAPPRADQSNGGE